MSNFPTPCVCDHSGQHNIEKGTCGSRFSPDPCYPATKTTCCQISRHSAADLQTPQTPPIFPLGRPSAPVHLPNRYCSCYWHATRARQPQTGAVEEKGEVPVHADRTGTKSYPVQISTRLFVYTHETNHHHSENEKEEEHRVISSSSSSRHIEGKN